MQIELTSVDGRPVTNWRSCSHCSRLS